MGQILAFEGEGIIWMGQPSRGELHYFSAHGILAKHKDRKTSSFSVSFAETLAYCGVSSLSDL